MKEYTLIPKKESSHTLSVSVSASVCVCLRYSADWKQDIFLFVFMKNSHGKKKLLIYWKFMYLDKVVL